MQHKRKRMNRPSKSKRSKERANTDITRSTKIDDVNLDCLEHAFGFLNLEDLINVAEGNKHLKAAANIAFKNKFKTYCLQIYTDKKQGSLDVYNDENCIVIWNLKLAFKLLRLFGENISGVQVWADKTTTKFKAEDTDIITYERIMYYINEYCFKSLTSFAVIRQPDNVFIGVQNKFENVKKVYINGNIGPETLLQLNHFFPRMTDLQLIYFHLNAKFIKFPYLERLRIAIVGDEILDKQSLITVITLNSHLRGFHFNEQCDPDIWKLVSTEMKNLEYLCMDYSIIRFERFENTPIHFEYVEELILHVVNDSNRTIEPKPMNVLTFSRLKICTIRCCSKHLARLLDFVVVNPQIEKLTFSIEIQKMKDLKSIGFALKSYAAYHPIHIELYLCNFKFNVQDFSQFVQSNQYLSMIQAPFRGVCEELEEIVRQQIPPEWKILSHKREKFSLNCITISKL